jgi:protein-S-isoprenylcysteine O-methyltransferase Ste14
VDAFRPDPRLDGLPLAAPVRRILAFALDVILLLVPSVAVAIGASVASLAVADPEGFDAVRQRMSGASADPAQERVVQGRIAALLVRLDAEGVPPALELAVAEGDLARAADILEPYDIQVTVGSGGGPPRAGAIKVLLDDILPASLRAAALFGVAALYFTLLTAGGRRTLGKRILGVRVAALDGRPLTVWESFERFGGYFASLGTFGIGVIDLWRDRNRRLVHDRLANTVVVDGRPRRVSNHAGVLVPPPFFFVAGFLAGLVPGWFLPLPVLPAVVARTIALPLLAIAAALLAWSFARFWRARTSVLPFRPSTALVIEGPYRFTRNPMYLAMLCVYSGTALWFGLTGPLLVAPLVMLAVGRIVIAREERYLTRAFGDEYRRYRASVRRWL